MRDYHYYDDDGRREGPSASVEPCGGLKMKKSIREALRMAEREGVERPRIKQGKPHGRLSGSVAGRPFEIVISLSKGEGDRFSVYLRDNIRKGQAPHRRRHQAMTICSNCRGLITTGATMVPDGKGGWRHAEKCGEELRTLVPRLPQRIRDGTKR